MGLTIKRKQDNRVVKCVLHRIADIPGGVTVSVANLGGSTLFEGTSLCNGTNGLFNVIKTAQVVTDYTGGTSLDVAKGHHFKAGDKITRRGLAVTATISSIDKSNAAKDVIALSAALGANLSAGDCIVLVTTSTVSSKKEAVAYGAVAETNVSSFNVDKGHDFVVGDIIAGKAADKFTGKTITNIDRGNDAYDTITVGANMAVAIADDDVLIAVKAVNDVGATAANQKSFTRTNINYQGDAVAFAGSNEDVESDSNLFVSAWVMGVIRESNAPIVDSAIKAALKGVIYV